MAYPNLRAEMARNNVTVPEVATAAGKSVAATSKNLNGKGEFSVTEGLMIRDKLFPVLTLEYLFGRKTMSGRKEESA